MTRCAGRKAASLICSATRQPKALSRSRFGEHLLRFTPTPTSRSTAPRSATHRVDSVSRNFGPRRAVSVSSSRKRRTLMTATILQDSNNRSSRWRLCRPRSQSPAANPPKTRGFPASSSASARHQPNEGRLPRMLLDSWIFMAADVYWNMSPTPI